MTAVRLGLALLSLSFDSYAAPTIEQLKSQTMLGRSDAIASRFNSTMPQWQRPYMQPNGHALLKNGAIWFDAYLPSIVKPHHKTSIEMLSDKTLLQALQQLSVTAIHTGPINRAGSYHKGKFYPSIDGGYDPIDYSVAPEFGNNKQLLKFSTIAKQHNIRLIGDIVPGHTGKGIDYYLALHHIPPYTGLYSLIEIAKKHWRYLPAVADESTSKTLTPIQANQLIAKGYLPGRLKRVLFKSKYHLTAWDATGVIKGVDGKKRRWVYLHYFKPGQPSLNWLDSSMSAQRLLAAFIASQRMHGYQGLRIDANPFLGLERIENTLQADSEATPLSRTITRLLAQLIRKFGGFSFQELNLPIADLKKFQALGPDFSYDFITRTGLYHAMLTGDSRLLNTKLNMMLKANIDSRRLVHALQNHDEITYELVEFTNQAKQYFNYGNKKTLGRDIRNDVMQKLDHVSHRFERSGNGVCLTLASLIARRFAIDTHKDISIDDKRTIQQGMELLAFFNLMQPGVFMVSGWDLTGSVNLDPVQLHAPLDSDDPRWLNRGAYNLLSQTQKNTSALTPVAQALFGPLDKQLHDRNSFSSHLSKMITLRKQLNIAQGKILKVFDANPAATGLLIELPNKTNVIAAVNFSNQPQLLKIAMPDKKSLLLKPFAYSLYRVADV